MPTGPKNTARRAREAERQGQRLEELQDVAPERSAVPLPEGEWRYGKLDTTLVGGAGNSVAMSVWELNATDSAWEDTGETLDKVYAPPLLPDDDTFSPGTWVIAQKRGGRWYVTNAGCGGG